MGSSQPRQNRESLALIAYFLGRIHTADSLSAEPANRPICSQAGQQWALSRQLRTHPIVQPARLRGASSRVLPRGNALVSISTPRNDHTAPLAKLSSIIACCYECSRLCRRCPRLCLHPTRLQGSARRLGQPTQSTLASASGGRRRLVCRPPLVLTPPWPCHRRLSEVLAACGHRNPPHGRAPTSHHPTQPHAKAPASAPHGRGVVRGRAGVVAAPAVAPPTVTVTAQMVVAQLAVGNATSARRLLQASR